MELLMLLPLNLLFPLTCIVAEECMLVASF